MKKLLCILFVALSINAMALEGHLKLGATTLTNSYNSESGTFEDYAPTFGFELTQGFIIGDFGAGIAYNKAVGDTEISTVPVYLLARLNLLPIFFEPYIVLKGGSILETEEDAKGSSPDGKAYLAGGVGVELDPFQVEILYSQTKIDDDNRGSDKLKQVSLIFGYKLF